MQLALTTGKEQLRSMIWQFEHFTLDTDAYELRHDETVVPVEPQVFDVLSCLARHHDRVVTKEELLDEVWGDRFVSESALTSRIKAARRAVGDSGREQRVIKTVHGRGYRFVAPVTAHTPSTDPAPARPRTAPPTPPPTPPAVVRIGAEPPRTRYTRSNDYDIAYQVIGDGPADLVFIPGFVSNLDLHWEHPAIADFFQRLARFSRLILFDKRGTGLSERVPSDRLPSLEERMDDVRAVLDAVGSERTSLFGISEGGPMSLLFAATHPERVERMVLYGTFASDPFEDPDRMVRITRRSWGQGRVFGALAPSWRHDPETTAFLARLERQSASPESASALVRLTSEIDARSVLSSISAPTLALHRAGDAIVPFDRAEVLAAGIADAELVALPGSDHYACVDAEGLLDHVERFLTGDAPAPHVERVLTTLLFVDVVDSTAQAARSGDERWRRTLEDLHARTDRQLARSGGTLVKRTGDGFLATFDGPARAVRCGLALVTELADSGLVVRCGAHTSEVERIDGDVAGLGVHVAARVEALAEPGRVWVTRTLRDLVAGSGLGFDPRGAHELKGVPDAWELFAAIG